VGKQDVQEGLKAPLFIILPLSLKGEGDKGGKGERERGIEGVRAIIDTSRVI